MKNVAATRGQSVSFATRFFLVEIACVGYWVGRDRELNFYFSSFERHSLSRYGEASSQFEEYKSRFRMQEKSALQANYFLPLRRFGYELVLPFLTSLLFRSSQSWSAPVYDRRFLPCDKLRRLLAI